MKSNSDRSGVLKGLRAMATPPLHVVSIVERKRDDRLREIFTKLYQRYTSP